MAGEAQVEKGRIWKRAAVVVGGIAVLAIIGAVIMSLMTEGKSKKRQVIQQIAVLRPPPPPPPPKPEEKPPEPEVQKQEVKMPEPDTPPTPQQAEAPPSPDLGVDAAGSGNGDSFGLVGKPGGKDITTIGGGGGDKFKWYAGQVQGEIQKLLAKNNKLRGVEFKAVLKIWLAADGKLQRSELSGSSGNAETDELIKLALADMPPLRESPPSDMPQPIRLRVTSRF